MRTGIPPPEAFEARSIASDAPHRGSAFHVFVDLIRFLMITFRVHANVDRNET